MAMMAIVLHDVHKNWILADRHHRLWQIFGIVADPGTEAAAEEHDFHGRSAFIIKIGSVAASPDVWQTIPGVPSISQRSFYKSIDFAKNVVKTTIILTKW